MNARIRRRKNPFPQPSPTNSIQDLLRRLPPKNNAVQIETPTNLEGKRKAVAAELHEEHNTRAKVAKLADHHQKKKKKKETRRADVTNGDLLFPELAEKFRAKVRELGFSGEPTLVIQKRLFRTDVSPNHQRLTMPESQIKNKELFSKMGRELTKPDGIEAILIDNRLQDWAISFGKWPSNAQYVLKSPWNEIVRENGLELDRLIQVWSFLMDNQLYFILVQ